MNLRLSYELERNHQPAFNSTVAQVTHNQITQINRLIFLTIIQAQLRGIAAIPYGLGLDACVYRKLLQTINDPLILALDERWHLAANSALRQRSNTITELTKLRIAERNAIVDLLFHASNMSVPNAVQAAIVVATACLSPSHLWKTLGLENREQLRTWLSHNFPTLVAENTNGMRWKRFFYLQLCKTEGDYVCRAPSCDACTSFRDCFSGDE